MSFLLDTCVLSEIRKRNADRRVVAWTDRSAESSLYVSVVTLAEIQKGIAKLADPEKKQALQSWMEEDLKERFASRILDIDLAVALKWGELQGEGEKKVGPCQLRTA